MVRRSTPPVTYFPVGIWVAVPKAGFGAQFEIMQAWLRAQLGAETFSMEAEQGEDAVLFRFLDLGAARAFIDRAAGTVRLSIPFGVQCGAGGSLCRHL